MHDEAVIAQWQRFGRWMRRGYDTLIDEEALAGLRELDRNHSLIFLISHRSYLDEWVLPPALVSSGILPPYGLAGANLNFFPLGTVARHTGMVHIRRSTSDAPVYRLALRAYIGQLVANRANLESPCPATKRRRRAWLRHSDGRPRRTSCSCSGRDD